MGEQSAYLEPGDGERDRPCAITHADLEPEVNLASFFLDHNLAEGAGDAVAIRTPDGTITTYAELSERANRVGNALRGLGLRREDRVLLILNDGVDFVAVWYGVVKIGAVVAETYTFLADKDVEYYLRYTACRAVVVDRATLPAVRRVRHAVGTLEWVLVVDADEPLGSGEVDLSALADEASAELETVMIHKDDAALWKFTTGSTGAPKGAVHFAHAPILCFAGYAEAVLGLRSSDVVLPVPKLFFGYARDLAALFPFRVGASSVIYPDRPNPGLLFDLIERFRPSVIVNVPTMMRAMLEDPGSRERDLSSLRMCISSGEGLPAPLCERWQETFGHEVIEGIGSSECYHMYASNRPGRGRPGSVGKPIPGYEIRIVGPDGEELGPDQVGELEVKAPSAAAMYWRDRPKSQRTFVGEWVRTGDLFERDADGFLRSRGRADDLIKVGGIWVAPAEIESCLQGHPDVVECAVVAHADRDLIIPRAFVVLRDGAEFDAVVLQEFVKSRLTPHKYPREVRALDALPKTPSGKVDRKALASPITPTR